MTYKIDLPIFWNECPSWWQDAITKHGASWVEDNGGRIIRHKNMFPPTAVEFESEEHFTFFLLSI
jgi:hypothetical protein